MRLIILLPAFNEQESIGDVIRRIPTTLPTIEIISTVVIDDGSTDDTAEKAEEAGALVLRHLEREGLASAFRTGLSHALRTGEDFIATIDADGQYRPEELSLLLLALQSQSAELVVGDRQVWTLTHMSLAHRIGNVVGSWMLRVLGTTGIRDASSGFRMFTRSFALKLRISSEHTYTHEMLIQASAAGSRTAEVPVTFLSRAHGRSKLVRSLHHHIFRSCGTILRSLFLYRPLRKFLFLATGCFVIALLLILPMMLGIGEPTSFVASGIFFVLGIQFVILGLLADAQAGERRVRTRDSSSAR